MVPVQQFTPDRLTSPRFAAAGRQGLTLVEFVVLLVVLGILAVLAAPNPIGRSRSPNRSHAMIIVANVEKIAEIWKRSHHQYPQRIEELLRGEVSGEPRSLEKLPVDPWGMPILYEFPSTKRADNRPAIWSAGPNRQNDQGGSDDINNWADIDSGTM